MRAYRVPESGPHSLLEFTFVVRLTGGVDRLQHEGEGDRGEKSEHGARDGAGEHVTDGDTQDHRDHRHQNGVD